MMSDYLHVVDELIRKVESLPAAGTARIEVRVPAQIAEYGSVVTKHVFMDIASQCNVTATGRMAASFDAYELQGKREDVARVLRTFRSDLTEVGTFSGPINGFFLRARGLDDFIRFSADRSGVNCKVYGVSYLDAHGPIYKLADFIYLLKEVERQSNGALPLFDARQKILDDDAKAQEKARRKEERRERRRTIPVLRHIVRSSDEKGNSAPVID